MQTYLSRTKYSLDSFGDACTRTNTHTLSYEKIVYIFKLFYLVYKSLEFRPVSLTLLHIAGDQS